MSTGLPKAERGELSDELRHRLAVWPSGRLADKAHEDDNSFLTLARRPAVLDLSLEWVRSVYTDASRLSPKLVELRPIRSAVQNQCAH